MFKWEQFNFRKWGADGEGHIVTITLKELDNASTIIEVNEDGFN